MTREPELVRTRRARARGIVSSRVSGARIESRTYAPSPDLADLVALHWTSRWDLRDQEPHVFELLSDPSATLAIERDQSRVVGVWTRRWVRVLEGAGHIRAAKLQPGALPVLFARPAHELTDRIVPLAELVGARDAARLERQVLDAPDDATAFAALDAFLRARRAAPDPSAHEAARLVALVIEDPTIATVEQLVVRAGLGLRALQRLFRDYVGQSPKGVIRRARLQELARRLELGTAPNLARVAAELGYTDHAHLTRDFKREVGKSPRELAKRVHE
jgi:AraC-like DNA-binding protein